MSVASAGLIASACRPAETEAPDAPVRATGWTQPPRALAIEPRRTGLLLSGSGPAGARVLLTPEGGDPAAITVGPDGRFALPIPAPSSPTLFRLELDSHAARRPAERLLITPGGDAVALAAGAASRALTDSVGLTSLDYDGADLVAAGAAPAGAEVRLTLDGRTATTRAGSNGRFVAILPSVAPGSRRIVVATGDRLPEETTVALVDPAPGSLAATPSDGGLGLVWTTAGGGGQQTWFSTEKD